MSEWKKRELFSVMLSAISQVYLDDIPATKAMLKLALEKIDEIQSSAPTAKKEED